MTMKKLAVALIVSTICSAGFAAETPDYPTVPAKYLRPGASQEQKTEAVETLKTTVAKADAERKPVAKVNINQNTRIALKPGDNVYVPIAHGQPNRLLTPFKNPQIVSTNLSASTKKGECGEVCVRDGVIYVTTDSEDPVTAFITEKGNEEIAFSVTMIPGRIPPREIRFTLPADVVEKLADRNSTGASARKAETWETSLPYVETIRETLRTVALGQVPSGYAMRNIRVRDPLPTCSQRGLKFNWANGQYLEGFNLNVYVGVVENVADTPVEFRNESCGGWRTAAVTTWPLTLLKPGQKTEVYVVTKREDDVPADLVRKPLIDRVYN